MIGINIVKAGKGIPLATDNSRVHTHATFAIEKPAAVT